VYKTSIFCIIVLRKFGLTLSVVTVSTVFGISVFSTPLSRVLPNMENIRICRNETCLRSSEVVSASNYHGETVLRNAEKNNTTTHSTIIGYITLTLTIVSPLIAFAWWLINNQQDKKITEFSKKQDFIHKDLLDSLLSKQDVNAKLFSNELKELILKIDVIGRSIGDMKLEHVEKNYQQEINILNIKNNLGNLDQKITHIENYLNKRDDFHIRN
jgi:hypothetical protein